MLLAVLLAVGTLVATELSVVPAQAASAASAAAKPVSKEAYLTYKEQPQGYYTYSFSSPSGNIRCSIAQYEDSAPWGCYTVKRTWKDPKLPYIYGTTCAQYGNVRVKGAMYAKYSGGGFYVTCGSNPGNHEKKSKVLLSGSKITVNKVVCTSNRVAGAEAITCTAPKDTKLTVSKTELSFRQPKHWIP